MRQLSIVMAPWSALESMKLCICGVLPSRIRFWIAWVTIMTSAATTRPWPFARTRSCWLRTAFRVVESCRRIWPCRASGNTLTIRSIESTALFVCSVAKTRWPVSAAVSAVSIVARSRISPIRMMSGSSRRMARRPSA